MEVLHVWGICDLTIDSYVKVREKHDGPTDFLWNQLPSSKNGLKVEAVMILRVHVYVKTNSPCKDREQIY